MKSFTQVGTEVGELVERKHAAYGNAVARAAAIMAILFPDGIRPNQYHLAIVISRIVEKLSRAATDNDPSGESPFLDIAGHAIKALVELERTQGCGSAKGPDAAENSTIESNSAALSAEPLITPIASEKSVDSSSSPSNAPSSPGSTSMDVAARTATESASASEDARRAIEPLVEAAERWHKWHAGSMVQCDGICDELPEARRGLALLEGR